MSSHDTLIQRNTAFAETFAEADLSVLPGLNTVVLACVDARVDPAHILGLDLGDAVVFRNSGGRVTQSFIDEIAAIAALVARMTGTERPEMNLVLVQHTQCGAERFADPEISSSLRDRIGVDMSENVIIDQRTDLPRDIERLCDTRKLPGSVTVSALLYDVRSGHVEEIAAPVRLDTLRAARDVARDGKD